MEVFAVVNQKGGVGKTTTTVSLAGIYASRGYRVLIIDIDPQGSLSSYFNLADDNGGGVHSIFQDPSRDIQACIHDTGIRGIDIVTASPAIATMDRVIGGREGKGLILSNALQSLQGRYDKVIIDCPPVLGVLMVNAIAAADMLLLPVQAEFLALNGLAQMINTIRMVSHTLSRSIDYLIVPTLFDRRTRVSFRCLEQLGRDYPANLWASVIPVDTQFREASGAGVPINHLKKSSRGSLAYELLLDSLEQRRSDISRESAA